MREIITANGDSLSYIETNNQKLFINPPLKTEKGNLYCVEIENGFLKVWELKLCEEFKCEEEQ